MIREWFSDLSKLLFPANCITCRQSLLSDENHICSLCLADLPQTNFHKHTENALSRKFKGLFEFEMANAFYYFNAEGKMQEILHEIKYRGNTALAHYLGRLMAMKLDGVYADVDLIIPVPLHKKRMEERGYNQSQLLAQGLSAVWNIPVKSNAVSRIKNTETQTHKSRIERVENMNNAFEFMGLESQGHILLVDDVITTGATMESLAHVIVKSNKYKISILSLAAAIEL